MVDDLIDAYQTQKGKHSFENFWLPRGLSEDHPEHHIHIEDISDENVELRMPLRDLIKPPLVLEFFVQKLESKLIDVLLEFIHFGEVFVFFLLRLLISLH